MEPIVDSSHVVVDSAQAVSLICHTGATGGVLVAAGQLCFRLTPVQFSLVQLLCEQRGRDTGKHPSVRGYVSSAVLLATLPWETPHPDLAHLKQLVRRLRRRLQGTGVSIESLSGLGYRLQVEMDDMLKRAT